MADVHEPVTRTWSYDMKEAARKPVFHTHIHLILRDKRDVENLRRGIRNVIPGMEDY
ncbi:hypothetical protein [Gracilimonas sp.]|uniref:hypothetical protein n=1 Tax=Gracilimonas sp. TaxID=1974203 RepID=UPI0028719BEB|nr:hypothetical protein [Gracilimonas sp.]